MPKHGDEYVEPAVRDSSESAAVGLAAGPGLGIHVFGLRVPDDAGARPVIEGIAQSLIATLTHDHGDFFAALVCDRSCPTVTPQGMVISFSDSLGSFAEHRGGDFSSHSRQGQEDGRVTMLLVLAVRTG